jgi:hypothetical protein
MSFHTEIQIPEFSEKMDYSKSMMYMGSCFSENIGQKMVDLKFNVDLNPFGILYNPVSIANSLKILIDKRFFSEYDLFQDQGLWNSFYHHSRFSDVDPDVVLKRINSRIESSSEFLKNADFLVLTFGTAYAYELKSLGQIVSNCHKVPASQFMPVRLGVHEIAESYRNLMEELWSINPKLKIIFTVSPIRHWKDGAVNNQVSKSILLLAIDRLKKGYDEKVCSYFPAYELVMDELRDYRYYAEDMLHLNSVAIDYIFDRFSKVMISKDSEPISNEVVKIMKAIQHRPFNSNSAEHEKFLNSTLKEIDKLTSTFPSFDFAEERKYLEQELASFKGSAT